MVYEILSANDLAELDEQVENYIATWPTPGYGTWAGPAYRNNGKWECRMTRYSSCD